MALTEQAAMRQFIELHGNDLRYNHTSGRWLVWKDHYWCVDGTDLAFDWALQLARAIPQPDRDTHKIKFAGAIERAARAQREVATEQSEWDADPWLLGTPDGTVDLRTGELRGGKRSDMISRLTAVTPNENVECPRWLDFLDYAQDGNADMIAFLQRYCGYCLTGFTREEVLLYVYGKPGTGKGTFTKTVVSIMGDYARIVPADMFVNNSPKAEYYRADIAGRRLILASEPEAGSTWSEGFVNEITGSDRLPGRHPAGRPFDYNPTHKAMINGNVIPDLKGVATGLKRRLLLDAFDRIPLVPDERLKDALRDEYPGILRWAITGCLNWEEIGLSPPERIKADVADYFALRDTLARWIAECCDRIPTGTEAPSVLRASYNAWAIKSGERVLSFAQFHEAIKNCSDPTVRQGKTDGKRWVKGIILRVTDRDGPL